MKKENKQLEMFSNKADKMRTNISRELDKVHDSAKLEEIIGGKKAPEFDGAAYVSEFDHSRLKGQMLKIWDLMKDGQFRTLQEIAQATNAPEASASAQLRNLRKQKFGSHTVERRRRGDRSSGLFEYKLIPYMHAG